MTETVDREDESSITCSDRMALDNPVSPKHWAFLMTFSAGGLQPGPGTSTGWKPFVATQRQELRR